MMASSTSKPRRYECYAYGLEVDETPVLTDESNSDAATRAVRTRLSHGSSVAQAALKALDELLRVTYSAGVCFAATQNGSVIRQSIEQLADLINLANQSIAHLSHSHEGGGERRTDSKQLPPMQAPQVQHLRAASAGHHHQRTPSSNPAKDPLSDLKDSIKEVTEEISLLSNSIKFKEGVLRQLMKQEKIASQQRSFESEYTQGEMLGYGASANVYKGAHKATNAPCAIKVVDRTAVREDIWNAAIIEAEMLGRLRHRHVVELKDFFLQEPKCYMVMELLLGGELFDKIVQCKRFTEGVAAQLMANLLSAIQYLHNHSICHRDLKMENLMLKESFHNISFTVIGNQVVSSCSTPRAVIERMLANITLVDFGFATRFTPDLENLSECCGTIDYMAPEIIQVYKGFRKGYGSQCDLWSCGVLAYTLLCGFPPFYANTDEKIMEKITRCQYAFVGGAWDSISADAKDFVSKLLVLNPHQRITPGAALQHPWIRKMTAQDTLLSPMVDPKLPTRLQTHIKLRGAMLVIAFITFLRSKQHQRKSKTFEESQRFTFGCIGSVKLQDVLPQTSQHVITLREDTPVRSAFEVLSKNNFLSCPVVSMTGGFLGFVDVLDLLGIVVDVCQRYVKKAKQEMEKMIAENPKSVGLKTGKRHAYANLARLLHPEAAAEFSQTVKDMIVAKSSREDYVGRYHKIYPSSSLLTVIQECFVAPSDQKQVPHRVALLLSARSAEFLHSPITVYVLEPRAPGDKEEDDDEKIPTSTSITVSGMTKPRSQSVVIRTSPTNEDPSMARSFPSRMSPKLLPQGPPAGVSAAFAQATPTSATGAPSSSSSSSATNTDGTKLQVPRSNRYTQSTSRSPLDFYDQGSGFAGPVIKALLTHTDIIHFFHKYPAVLGHFAFKTLTELGQAKKPLWTVSKDDTALEAFTLMRTQELTAVAIVDENRKFVGSLSTSEMRKFVAPDDIRCMTLTVERFLAIKSPGRLPVACGVDAQLGHVIKLMVKYKTHRVYVVDENRVPRSVVTTTDLMRVAASIPPPPTFSSPISPTGSDPSTTPPEEDIPWLFDLACSYPPLSVKGSPLYDVIDQPLDSAALISQLSKTSGGGASQSRSQSRTISGGVRGRWAPWSSPIKPPAPFASFASAQDSAFDLSSNSSNDGAGGKKTTPKLQPVPVKGTGGAVSGTGTRGRASSLLFEMNV